MIESLARTTPPVPVESVPEPVLTLEQISKRLNVSTKTISRWKHRGLVSRRVLCNGRKQVGFVQSVVDRFLKSNQEHVEKSGRFSQLSEVEKEDILRRAKRLSRVSGGTLTEVSRRIEERTSLFRGHGSYFAIIWRCSTIGPRASAGMNVSAPTNSTIPAVITTNSGV